MYIFKKMRPTYLSRLAINFSTKSDRAKRFEILKSAPQTLPIKQFSSLCGHFQFSTPSTRKDNLGTFSRKCGQHTYLGWRLTFQLKVIEQNGLKF